MKLWLLRTDSVREEDGEALRESFPKRMALADRFRRPGDRLRCIGAGLLLRDALGVEQESALTVGDQGKLYLPGGPEFNLSHSGDWIALASDEAPLGVDVEQKDPNLIRGVRRISNAEERAWAGEDLNRLFRLWTWKEGLIKATGRGFSSDPTDLCVLPFGSGGTVEAEGRRWHAASLSLDDYILSVVSASPAEALRPVFLRSEPFQEEIE